MLAILFPVWAQELPELDAQLFDPSVDATYTLWTDDTGGHETPTLRALAGYTDAPLVYQAADGSVTEAIGSVSTLDVAGSLQVGSRLRLGARLPLVLGSAGDLVDGGGGLGDVGAEARALLVDRSSAGVGLALVAGGSLPSSTLGPGLASPGGTWFVGAISDVAVGDGRLAVNLGHRAVPDTGSELSDWGDQLYARLGYGVPVTDRVVASGELATHLSYLSTSGAGAPLEGLLGAGVVLSPSWRLTAGAGAGLNPAVGSPRLRLLGGVAWQRAPRVEAAVAEVTAPEPPPRVLEPQLGELGFSISGPAGEIDGAAFELDRGGVWRPIQPGVSHDVPPGQHEVRVRAPGFVTARSVVSVSVGARSELAVVLVPSKVKVTAERIEISEKIFFATGDAVILETSHPLLAQVAEVLQDHPDVRRVRIEGHTDSRGAADANLELSQRRADAVRDWLVEAGIELSRLESVGYGESRPVDTTETETAWSKNRRVEFVILARER